MEQQQCLPSAKKKKPFFAWWDPFSRCRGEEALDSENGNPCNDTSASTAARDCSGDGCVETAIDHVMSILRGLVSRCGEEDQVQTAEEEVATIHHNMEDTSTWNGSFSDDKIITESISDPVDNIDPLSPSNGSSFDEEEDLAQADEAIEVIMTHHVEPTSTCSCSCPLDDKIEESNSEPVDENILVAMEPQSEHDIPDIDGEQEALHTDPTVATSLNVVANRSVKEDVDTALSWFVLSGILGSSAPSSVIKDHGRKKDTALLFWDLDEGIIRGDYDDIPDIQEDSIDTVDTSKDKEGADRLNDSYSTASILSETEYESEADLCSVPEIDDLEQFVSNDEFFSPMAPQTSVKKVADSALAWGALAMILNAPAPSAVASSCTAKNVFEDDDLTVELDDVVL